MIESNFTSTKDLLIWSATRRSWSIFIPNQYNCNFNLL